MLSLVVKCLIGAAAVLLIAILSKSRSFYIAGLVPTFALVAHWIVGTDRSPTDLRTTALFGLWSLLPYAIYLVAVYLVQPAAGHDRYAARRHRRMSWPPC